MLIPNGFTRLSTSPILLALLDLIFFPVSIISRASGSPTWRNHDNYQTSPKNIYCNNVCPCTRVKDKYVSLHYTIYLKRH